MFWMNGVRISLCFAVDSQFIFKTTTFIFKIRIPAQIHSTISRSPSTDYDTIHDRTLSA
jgi:hypothetical protein